MGDWRTRTDVWLLSDDAGDEAAAEAALTDVFGAFPPTNPSDGFVQRTVAAAWASPRRATRRISVYAAATAVVGVTAAVSVVVSTPIDWTLAVLATTGARSVLSVATAMATVAGWWASAGQAGTTLVSIVLMREIIVALFAVGLVGAGASWALQRVLREQPGPRTLGPVCV
jgi:hypothetical protein